MHCPTSFGTMADGGACSSARDIRRLLAVHRGLTAIVVFSMSFAWPKVGYETDQALSGTMQFRLDRQNEIRPWWHVLLFMLAASILVSRRRDAIFHAQFWAEDGHVWFSDAYNVGLAALFRTQDGYFQTLPRLAGMLAVLLPLSLAPLALNLVAISVQALPVNLLLSSRSNAWGSMRYRALMTGLYLALPNCREMGAVVTSSQWVLALCAFLLLVASTPKGIAGRVFDISVLLLCGLTGPFCVFMLPIAVFLAWRQQDRWRWMVSSLLGVLCLVQSWALLIMDPSGRAHGTLGANPVLLIRIIAGQIYLGTILGSNVIAADSVAGHLVYLLLVAIVGSAIIAFCFVTSTRELKLFVLLSLMLLAASLVSPAAYPTPGVSRWELLAQVPGLRYWFFPTLAFAWSLLYLFTSRWDVLKVISGYLLLLMCIGIIRDWRHPDFTDMHFEEHAKQVEAAPTGTVFIIPQNPQGWTLRLVKRPAGR